METEEPLRKRQFPWGTLVLAIVAFSCHLLVLIGNCQTASAVHELGKSTAGWSKVGIGMARSLEIELDRQMDDVMDKMVESLHNIRGVQSALDMLLPLVEEETDAALSDPGLELALLQRGGPHALSLMQVQGRQEPGGAIAKLVPIILATVHTAMTRVIDQINDLMTKLWSTLKPALEQIGEWVTKFGDKIQDGLEMFSVTVDRAQKMIDKIMEKMTGTGENEEELFSQTFNLFDVSNTGFVTSGDLVAASEIYGIDALRGPKADELVDHYDENGDGQLDRDEFRMVVKDPSIPNAMPVLLRTYARKLSEIGGTVRRARRRHEIASAVVDYFQVVCAKNMTKVGWVADRLGNGTLPLEFTADVLAFMCLSVDDPNTFTTSDVGKTVVGEMYKLHPKRTTTAMDLMSDTKFWASAGFDIKAQPACVSQVLWWTINANSTYNDGNATGAAASTTLGRGGVEPGTVDREAAGTTAAPAVGEAPGLDPFKQGRGPQNLNEVFGMLALGGGAGMLHTLPGAAERLAGENVAAYLRELDGARSQRREKVAAYTTSQFVLAQLIDDIAPRDASPDDPTEQLLKSGEAAAPETLRFAEWLATNATTNAKRMQDIAFVYTSESSNALDSFATRLQGLVETMRSFLTMTLRYSTPRGIQRLEDNIQAFANHALQDLSGMIEGKITAYLTNHTELVENLINSAVKNASKLMGGAVGIALGKPLGNALVKPFVRIASDISNDTAAGQNFGKELGQQLGANIGAGLASVLAEKAASAMGSMVGKVLHSDDAPAPPPIQLVANHTETYRLTSGESIQLPSGTWDPLVQTLKQLYSTLPPAASNLKRAREVVSKESAVLETLFVPLYLRGPPVFELFAKFWRSIWVVYFACLMPLCIFILYYGFWAGGYFGGPKPLPRDAEAMVEPPRTWGERYTLCCTSFTYCMKKHHDTDLCFWSTILCMEVVVLILYVISIVLSILGGVKFGLVAACSQVYVLSDAGVCTDALANVKSFLDTFSVSSPLEQLVDTCDGNSLMTCALIKEKMLVSMILTGVFSFVATLVSLLMIIHSAQLHEQARWRRLANKVYAEQDAQVQGFA